MIIMVKNHLAYLVLILTLSSCAQRIKVPINRMISPEAIGKGAKVEVREMGFSSGVLDFSDNSTSNPLVMGTTNDKEFYLAVGVAQKADLFVRVPEESSSLIGIKVQVLGEPLKASAAGHSLSFSLGMGSERDKFEQTFSIDLKSDVSDFSLIHGYRMGPSVLLYDGISVSHYSFDGTISGTTGLSSDELRYSAENILGAHLGAIVGGSGMQVMLELATQKIEWTNTEEKIFTHFGMALNAGW
jgi:hypothetical protein